MYYGLGGSRSPRSSRPRTTYYRSEFIPIRALAASIAAVGQAPICVAGLTIVSNDRPLAIAVVRKEGDKWIWLPRKVISIGQDGAITMPKRIAEQKGLLPSPPPAV